MEYDDFLLAEDYSQIAKAYFQNMKEKGYAFVRLDDQEQKRKEYAQRLVDTLTLTTNDYKKIMPYLKLAEKQFLNQLFSLTQAQCESLKRMYDVQSQNLCQKKDIKKVVSNEAKILCDMLELLFLEQDENFAIIKNMIFERLQILKQE